MMSDAPATIGLVCDGVCDWREALTLEASTATYYVRADIAEQRIRELETVLKSAFPVYKQTSDSLGEMGIVIEPTVMYYRIEPEIYAKALEQIL